MRKVLIVFVLLLFVPVFVSAQTYYVDKDSTGGTCSDSNPGTKTQPWCTIEKANLMLQPGDTVYVRNGTYNEKIEPENTGTAGNKITYKAYPNEKVTLRGEPGKFAIITLGYGIDRSWVPKSYFVIDGFTLYHIEPIRHEQGYAHHIIITGENSHHNEIRNNEIRCQGTPVWGGAKEHGIQISKSKHNVIENNYIDGLCKHGILLGKTAQYNIVRNNTILNTHQNNIDVGSSKGVMQGNLIENNILCGSLVEDGIQFETDYNLPSNVTDYDSNRGVVIRNNVICDSAENAIDMKGGAYIVIEHNIIYGSIGNNNGGLEPGVGDNRIGPPISHGSGAGSRDVIVRNNVIYDCHGGVRAEENYKIYNNVVVYNQRDYTGPHSNYTSTRKPDRPGIIAWGNTNKVSVKNNIIGGHYVADIALSRNPPDFDVNNNIYFNTDGGAKFVEYRDKYDWDVLSFNDWKSYLAGMSGVSGADANSMETDPLFVNVPPYLVGEPEQFDFHVQAGSPCINGGTHLTKTTSSGNGKSIPVEDADYFFDGYNITEGDLIQLEGQTQIVRITSVDYDNNIITVNTSLIWNSGQGVSLPYFDSAPDIGAYEYSGEKIECYQDSDCGTDPCKTYTCSNPGTTSAYCSSQDITSCINDDGCCPSGCTEQNDNDCEEGKYETQDSEDALLASNNPTFNYGEMDSYWVGSRQDNQRSRVLLKFPGIISSNKVPQGSTITSANLIFTHTGTQLLNFPIDLKLRRVLESWAEGDKWATQADPGETTWGYRVYDTQRWASDLEGDGGTNGGCSSPESHTITNEVSKGYTTNPSEGEQASFDVTSIVQHWANNGESSNHGLILIAPGQEGSNKNYIRFASSEHSTLDYRPKLIVNFAGEALPGDLDGDGDVDIVDLTMVTTHFGKTSGFDPEADVIQNGEIDIYDIVFVASRFT